VNRIRLLPLLAAALAIAGCGSSSDDSGSTQRSQAPGAPTAGKPKGEVRIVTPKSGAKTSSTLHVRVALKHFKIAPGAVGQAPRPGEGHLHFTMDGGKYDFPKYSGANGLIAKKLGVTGHYSPALAPKITYKGLPPGKHVLVVNLANNNHTTVGVKATVAFTLR
jgi:hypothetical protein